MWFSSNMMRKRLVSLMEENKFYYMFIVFFSEISIVIFILQMMRVWFREDKLFILDYIIGGVKI